MKRFKNILVIVDWQKDYELLLKRTFKLARRNKSKLSLVEIFDKLEDVQRPSPLHSIHSLHSRQIRRIYSEGIDSEINKLELRTKSLRSEGVDITVTPIQGNPVIEISRKVMRDGHDLVMIGIEEKVDEDGVENPLWGLPLRLMRKCPCAVWAMKPTPVRGLNRIVAAVSPGYETDRVFLLNKKIMELASSLAETEESELHVFHAWMLHGEAMLKGKIDNDVLEGWLSREKAKSEEALDRIIHPFEGKITKRHLQKGVADILLPLFIKDVDADLLVMGTLCRTGITGFFIGNTAEKILQKINCSVLAIKPDGFVGPIK
ncbi:MAG: hypothetical protein DRP64_05640 [Verrucomicrobia bacterium]|nr:MAG: hypothetical protein DRP64_05640 [Verrucomicrobiota bacterium]